tara:strand:+ start:705 stop:1274 length:570 start_codon:yes stop_codon:yes gene_type:complete
VESADVYQFIKEAISLGENVEASLLRERMIFLDGEINDQVADSFVAKLIFLEADNPNKDIQIYINSAGGSVFSALAIYDTIQQVTPDVSTICCGKAGGMAAFLLASGCKGKRSSYQNGEIFLTPFTTSKQSLDVIESEEIRYLKDAIYQVLSEVTGQSIDQIKKDTSSNFFMTPTESVSYGLIDTLIQR